MMWTNLTYECGYWFTQDLEPWSQRPEEQVRASHALRGPVGAKSRLRHIRVLAMYGLIAR